MVKALFSYRRGTTVMHKTPAIIKLAILMVLCICTFTNGPHELIRTGICFALSTAAFFLSGARRQTLRQLAFVPILGALVTLFGSVTLPFPTLNMAGLRAGVLYTVRFFVTALAAQTVFETTSSIEIKDALESLQNVIARIIPPVKEWNPALVISLAITFLPQVFETWNRVHLAARARSGTEKKKNVIKTINTAYLELQALFSCLLHQAETTRQALLNRSSING